MGRLLPPIDTHSPLPHTHHIENNTEAKKQQQSQVNLLVNLNNGYSLPRSKRRGSNCLLLTSWPERLNNGDCKTCLSHCDITSSSHSTTSLNLITEIKEGDSARFCMLPNGTTTTTTSSSSRCPSFSSYVDCSSPCSLAQQALRSPFDPLNPTSTGRMVRSLSLGLDLPTRTNGDGCDCEYPVSNQSLSESGSVVVPLCSPPPSPLTLSAVLENIPIVYDPQTKKLHIIEVKETQSDSVFEVPNNNNNNNNNEDRRFQCDSSVLLECIPPPPPVFGSQLKLNRVSTSGSLPSSSRVGGECSSSEFSSVSSLSTEFSSTALEDHLLETNSHHPRGSTNSNCGSYVDSIDENGSGFIEINLDRHSITSRSGLDSELGRGGGGAEGGRGTASSSEDADLDAGSLDECLGISQGAKPKRRGITGFLSRNLLSWKSRDLNSTTNNNYETTQHQQHGGSGSSSWKLFSRSPQHQDLAEKDNNTCKNIEEYHHVQQQQESVSKTPRSRRSDDLVASSTTALILENRPLNLPAKAPEEELKHKLEYKQMVEAAKRRELKEAKLRKKYLQRQLKHEEQLSLASKIWNIEILPNWDSMRQCRKAREMWWRGIPPSVRGKVWKLAIGNDLHVTPELYEICVCRAKDRIRMAAESISVSEDDVEAMTDKEGSVELIKLDVSRTFPQLCIFQKGGPYYDMLHSLLGAYVCYRPDVGYVQGMSFLAAVLILNLEVADAFICFANLLNQPCQLAFFRLDEPMMRSYFLTYKEFFRENMPNLFEHFCTQNLSPDLYLIDWIYTLYSRSLPLDVASRVWDVYFRDGDEFLFRTALGILRQYEDLLLCMDFIHVAQFLTKLPEDMMAEPLFKSIESIHMVSEKRNFAQVLATHTDSKLT